MVLVESSLKNEKLATFGFVSFLHFCDKSIILLWYIMDVNLTKESQMPKTIIYENPLTHNWFFDYNTVKKQLEEKGYEEVLVARIEDGEKAMFRLTKKMEDKQKPFSFLFDNETFKLIYVQWIEVN